MSALWLWKGKVLQSSPSPDPAFHAKTPNPPQRLVEGCSEVKELVALLNAELSVGKSPTSATPLGTDEVLIYRAVIDGWISGHHGTLNLSQVTFPHSTTLPAGFASCDCLQGIHLLDPAPFYLHHTLTSLPLKRQNIRLVNPALQSSIVRRNDPDIGIGNGNSVESAVDRAFENGLFSLSEVAFDADHRYAVVAYRFWCGSLCGSGNTLVFEKIGTEWRKTNRHCGGWIS